MAFFSLELKNILKFTKLCQTTMLTRGVAWRASYIQLFFVNQRGSVFLGKAGINGPHSKLF